MKVRHFLSFWLSLGLFATMAKDVMAMCGSKTKNYSNNQHDAIMSYVSAGNSAEALGDAAALRAQQIQAANHCQVPAAGSDLTASADGPSCINAESYNEQGELAATNLTEAVRQYDICINNMQAGWNIANARANDIGGYESRPPEPICASMVDSAANKATNRMQNDRSTADSEKAACELKKAQTLTMIDATRTVAKHGLGEQTSALTATGTMTNLQTGTVTTVTTSTGASGDDLDGGGGLPRPSNLSGRANGAGDGDGDGLNGPDLITANGGRSLAGSESGSSRTINLETAANGQPCAMRAADGRCLTAQEMAAMMAGGYGSGDGADAEGAEGRNGVIVRNMLTVTDKEGSPLRLFPLATLAYQGCSNDATERGCQLRKLAEAEAGRQRRLVIRAPASVNATR